MDISRTAEIMGAEVRGLCPSMFYTSEVAAELNQALLDHQKLCLKDQELTPDEYAVLGQVFGAPKPQLVKKLHLEGIPEISVISNYNDLKNGKPYVSANYWHTDDSYFAVPAKATMLYGKALPADGGDTQFINTYAVLDAMPADLRARIDGVRAVHVYVSRRGKSLVQNRSNDEEDKTPPVVHPLIRTHPETGRQSLYINPNRIDHIEGMSLEDGDSLLDELYEFAFQEKFQHRHRWTLGEIIVWDNRCTMHRASNDFDVTQRREFHRILLEGTVPV